MNIMRFKTAANKLIELLSLFLYVLTHLGGSYRFIKMMLVLKRVFTMDIRGNVAPIYAVEGPLKETLEHHIEIPINGNNCESREASPQAQTSPHDTSYP